ncbi:Mog1p/PsbP-like protein [Sparassis crispa]|uniref:Mog1p/PsbP-like protein n=1 Tax=Sparassis crispa TaxID=139825 RepID=A0A401GJZ0_9APHY|nr:Mog1p/PsbP-like protein [Sparassis crispa]GBE82487.1 Mog1p/PsbP-like protein [Sparassis crispa]
MPPGELVHFDALAYDNSSEKDEILQVEQLSQDTSHQMPAPVVLSGTQAVPKFNSTAPDRIRVLLAVYRVQSHNLDLVMTMNVPTETHDGGAVNSADWANAQDVFLVAARSLKIIDYGLFA